MFLDMQEANRCLTAGPNQNMLFGRRLEDGGSAALRLRFYKRVRIPLLTLKPYAPKWQGVIHCPHSIDHVPFDMVDYVPSHIPDSSFPATCHELTALVT